MYSRAPRAGLVLAVNDGLVLFPVAAVDSSVTPSVCGIDQVIAGAAEEAVLSQISEEVVHTAELVVAGAAALDIVPTRPNDAVVSTAPEEPVVAAAALAALDRLVPLPSLQDVITSAAVDP
jgi:hypothetical protein